MPLFAWKFLQWSLLRTYLLHSAWCIVSLNKQEQSPWEEIDNKQIYTVLGVDKDYERNKKTSGGTIKGWESTECYIRFQPKLECCRWVRLHCENIWEKGLSWSRQQLQGPQGRRSMLTMRQKRSGGGGRGTGNEKRVEYGKGKDHVGDIFMGPSFEIIWQVEQKGVFQGSL